MTSIVVNFVTFHNEILVRVMLYLYGLKFIFSIKFDAEVFKITSTEGAEVRSEMDKKTANASKLLILICGIFSLVNKINSTST